MRYPTQAKLLKDIRNKTGLDVKVFATKVGIHFDKVYRLENGTAEMTLSDFYMYKQNFGLEMKGDLFFNHLKDVRIKCATN